MKALALASIFFGEMLVIYAELTASHALEKYSQIKLVRNRLFLMSVIMTIAGFLLLIGFMIGVREYDSIWIVNVASTSLVIIIEPFVAYYIFRYAPNKSTIKALLFAAAGLLCALFI